MPSMIMLSTLPRPTPAMNTVKLQRAAMRNES